MKNKILSYITHLTDGPSIRSRSIGPRTDFLVQTFDTLRIYKTIRLGKTYETTKFWDFENSKQKNQCYSTSALVYLMLLNMHDVSLVQLKLIWFLWWRCAEIQKSEIQTSQSPIMHLNKESVAVLILVVYAYHIHNSWFVDQ